MYFMMDTRKMYLVLIVPTVTVICTCLTVTAGDHVHRMALFEYHNTRVRLKRNSENQDSNVNIGEEGGNLLCNKDTEFSCRCISCDQLNSDNSKNSSGTRCCDLVLKELSSDSLTIVFKRDTPKSNDSITEEKLKSVIASALLRYCESSPLICNFKSGASMTGILSSRSVLVSRIVISQDEQTSYTLIVAINKDIYDRNALITSNSENPVVAYPLNYLRSALRNQISWISESLEIDVKSISLGLKMHTMDVVTRESYVSTESYIVTTEEQEEEEDDLNVTGIVFGGIFAFLFIFTCFASAHKAVK